MESLSLDEQIIKLLPLLGDEEKTALLAVMQTFVKLKGAEEEPPFDIDEYNREIDEAEAEIERGEFLTHEEMKAEIQKWKQQVRTA